MDWLTYANQNATRRLPLSPDLVSALSFVPELGLSMEVYSGGQPAPGQGPRVGSTRHDHGKAADVRFYRDGNIVNFETPEGRKIGEEIIRRGRQSGLTGIGYGVDYMGPTSMHLGFGDEAVWGAGGRSANADDWVRQAFYGGAGDDTQIGGLTMTPSTQRPQQEQRPDLLSQVFGMQEPEPEAVGGLLGKLFPNMKPEGADRLRATLASMGAMSPVGPNQAVLDDVRARRAGRRETQASAAQQNKTLEWLVKNGMEDLARALQGGVPANAVMGEAMARMRGPEAPKPYTDQAKISADLRAGLITQEQAQAALGGLQAAPSTPPIRRAEVYNNGVSLAITDTGPIVWDAQGNRLQGADAQRAIDEGVASGVAEQGERAAARVTGANTAEAQTAAAAEGARVAGSQGVELGREAWASAGQLRSTIGTMDEAIAAIDQGARAGAIDRYLPNITEASASLANAMDRMGLDVVSATTFGALSEGELRLAMDVAVPRNLDEAELRNWLVKRREARAKTVTMMEDAAAFLSKPGNTLSMWIEKNKTGGGRGSDNDPLGIR